MKKLLVLEFFFFRIRVFSIAFLNHDVLSRGYVDAIRSPGIYVHKIEMVYNDQGSQ